MSEFNRVEHATVSPTKCALCHTHEGPFIDVHLEQMSIATATGVVEYQGHIYICTRAPELGRTGCVEQLGYAAGTMVEHIRVTVKEVEIENLHKQIAALEADRDDLINKKTVPVKQLRRLLAEQHTVDAVVQEPVPVAGDYEGW